MLIVNIDKQPVSSAAEAKESLGKASLEKGILIKVQSPENGVNYLMLKASSSN